MVIVHFINVQKCNFHFYKIDVLLENYVGGCWPRHPTKEQWRKYLLFSRYEKNGDKDEIC